MRMVHVCMVGVVVIGSLTAAWLIAADSAKPADKAAVDRTRQTVKMLDDVYKTAVVLITDKYVHGENDFPAGGAAIALFDAIEKKGWHRVRLLDVSGDPYDSENVAKDAFEKKGVEKIKSGESFVEEVEQADGKHFLRAMTPIPVVMAKCAICHPHYKNVGAGKAIGALSYRVPIQ